MERCVNNNNNNVSGKLVINEYGNGFVNINNISIYISKKDLNNAFHNEIVEVNYYKENNKYYGKVINYSLMNKKIIGKVHHFYKDSIFIYCSELKKSNLIKIKTHKQLFVGNWVEVIIKDHNNNILIGELIDILQNDVNILIEKKFKLKDIDNIYILNNNFIDSNRVDLKYLDTFTIDPIDSMDCDDAFSIDIINDKIHIYVHISDTAHYINPTINNFDEIMKRGNTFYGKNKNWSMIPKEFANNICSILPNKETYVITHEFIYNNKKVEFVKWYYSVIESKNKYHYEYVDENFETNNYFKILYESSIYIKENLKEFDMSHDTKSHSMIKYWMIETNRIMCKVLDKIYRYNTKPFQSKLELLKNYAKIKYNIDLDVTNRDEIYNFYNNCKLNNDILLIYLMKLLLQKAYYSEKNSEEIHYGLGLYDYTHWTSPIRRSSDLVCHLLLKGYIFDYKKYLVYMNEQELIQNEIENFINLYDNNNKAIINKIYEGYIININQTGIIIYIQDFDDKYSIHISKLSNTKLIYIKENNSLVNEEDIVKFKLFEKINIKLEKIDDDNFIFSNLIF
jgi:ribonuclease R